MKSSVHVINERRNAIISALEESVSKALSVELLSQNLGVSGMTIRRDLTALEEMGIITRTHGQARLNGNIATEGDTKNAQLEAAKDAIATKAASYIKDFTTIFINSGSTALQVIPHLKDMHVTIVTNNMNIGHIHLPPSATVILTGGEVRFPKKTLFGDFAIDAISKVSADIAILGCRGISAEKGITTENLYESKINELMIRNTNTTVIVVADYRKVGHNSNFHVSNLESIDYLITDRYADLDTLKAIEAQGVTVIQVDF